MKDEDKAQHPIYFISKALKGAQKRYPRHVSLEVTIILSVSQGHNADRASPLEDEASSRHGWKTHAMVSGVR